MLTSLCLLAFPSLVLQETDVPEHLRRTIERHAVALRVVGEDGEELGYGSGVFVSAKDSVLYALTARHVVLDAATGDLRGQVQLLIGGAWKDAGPKVRALGDLDAALVAVSLHQAEIDRASLFDELRAAPRDALTRGTTVWAFGWDTDEIGLTWRGGSILERSADFVSFESKGVKAGYSGCGVFTKAGEYVGLIVDEGSGGDLRALSFDRVFEEVRAQGLPIGIETSPIEAALAHCLRDGLTLGLCTRVDKQQTQFHWTAIRLASADDVGYSARMLGTRDIGGCRLSPAGDGELAFLMEKGGGQPNRVGVFRRSDELALEGFLVLQGQAGDAIATLAIPTGRSELLAALAVANRGRFAEGTLGISAAERKQLHLEGKIAMVSLDGARFRLPLDMPNDGSGPMLELPERFRINGGRLRADLLLSDGGAEARDRKNLLGRCVVHVRAIGAGEGATTSLRIGETRRQAVVLEIPVGAHSLTWTMGPRPLNARVVLENAVLESNG